MTTDGGVVRKKRLLTLGVLISGSGTTLQNLIERIGDGRLRGVRIGVVISSRSTVRGVELARAAGLPLRIIRRRDYADEPAFSDALSAALREAGVELAVMAGFLCRWRIPAWLAGRVLNIHPALLPAFGGRGMYGRRVHEAVLASGNRETGCTVHIADDEYDHGPIIRQVRVPVLAGDTPETLAERVGRAERELYPAVIQQIADEGAEGIDKSGVARSE
jgi:formyltetrahydrofolate-dependent phosphoribosylglycinamide formyltransferase